MAFKSKIHYITSQNCMYFIRENSQNIHQKRKWALWMRHQIATNDNPWEELLRVMHFMFSLALKGRLNHQKIVIKSFNNPQDTYTVYF
jgi:hypothetical protein